MGSTYTHYTWYSVKVDVETKEWWMLASTTRWEGDSKITTWGWRNPDQSKSTQGGTSYMDPSNVFIPGGGDFGWRRDGEADFGDQCEPGNAARFREWLDEKLKAS